MSILYIFCEGEKTSHDQRLLYNIIDGLTNVQIVASGGVRGMGSFSNGFLAKGGVADPRSVKLIYRDRDFDFPIPDDAKLITIPNRNNQFASYRTTIENYFIDSQLLHAFVKEKLKVNLEIDEIRVLLKEAAQLITPYSAARHALGTQREPMRGLSLKTTWTQNSGVLPDEFTKKACGRKMSAHLSTAIDVLSDITRIAKLEKSYSNFLDTFDESFIDNEEYLIWYNGKDLMAAFKKRLPNPLKDFSAKNCYKYALDKIDYTQFPDLVQLREEIEKRVQPE